MQEMSLGFSPCPNDTFIFNALINGLIDSGDLSFRERLEDVETLNAAVIAGLLDVSKVSFHLFGHVRESYALLPSGGALGRGCGPLVVSRSLEEAENLHGKTVAVPGRFTTAALLLRLFNPGLEKVVYLPFHEIMPAVAEGRVDAGVIIHESRFTYPSFGLRKLVDLGEWWETETGHPIPLGGIVARRSLGTDLGRRIGELIRRSVEYAFSHPEAARGYIARHAQEMSEEVCQAHIALYVNKYSLDYGADGAAAIKCLFRLAEEKGIVSGSSSPLFF